ncbi:PREDICTED: uncharacterized protein LOC106806358 [Priapulus caudatus]|uniref:Uncharacterized protein LOC106806358 n=1 Tax=Priapulus caudatus TaxID=37621 RepID=A0ABM1DUY4_PRICU|nr:PREDICTED: uncharacterized protein LOC106806358 [Priapulus caudatus]
MASANTSAKKYAAGTMDEMDISSMFHKLGNKLGWHEHGDLDTAIQTLSAKAKRHKSKLKLSSEKKTPVAKKENKNPTSKMSDCRNVLPLAEELGDVMKPLANFDSNNCLEQTPTSTGSLSERRRGKLSRKKGKLRTKTDTPTNVENHHTFAFPAPVSRNSGAHSKTKTNRSRRIVDCSSTGSDPEFQSSSTQEDGGGSDANGEGGGGDDDGFYEDSIFIHGDGDPDDDGGIKELPPDVSAYFSTTVVAGDGFAEAASSDGGNRGDYGGTYADLLAAEDRFSHVTVRSRGPRRSRSILDEWDDVPVSESTVLYTGASPSAGHAQNLARDVTPAATGVADSAGMREVSPSVNKRSTSEDTKAKELERGKNIFFEPPSFTKKATAMPKSTGGSSLADSRVAGAVDGNFGGNWERFDRKVESWGKLKRGSSLYFTCLDESVFIPDLATRLRVKEAADNRKPPTKEAARKNIFQSLTDLLREEKTIGDPGAPSKVDSDSPETTNASKTSVAEVVNLVDSSDDDDPGNSPRLIDEHVSPRPRPGQRGTVSPHPGQRGGVSRPRPGRGGGGASVKSRAVPPTIVTRADPAYAPRLDFLASLSAHVPAGRQRHVEAARYVLEFRHRRDALVRQLFALYNARAFDGRLPADLAVTWNARMTKTAGFTNTFETSTTNVVFPKYRLRITRNQKTQYRARLTHSARPENTT